jgi:hypothetical protein
MTIIALDVVPFRAHAPFPALLPCRNASWKASSVRLFSTACDSASIASVVSRWRTLSRVDREIRRGEVRRVGWVGRTIILFWTKIPW